MRDRIRVTGIASQYCTLPPYDRFFQILFPSPAPWSFWSAVGSIQPPVLLASLILAGCAGLYLVVPRAAHGRRCEDRCGC